MRTNPLSKNGFLIPRVAIAVFLCLAAISLTLFSFAGTAPKGTSPVQTPARDAAPAAQLALSALRGAGQPEVTAQVSRQTGYYSFVQAAQGAILAKADAAASPQARALAFLSAHGALFGMTDAERTAAGNGGAPPDGSDLQILRTESDELGFTHVRLDQSYKGLKVFGAQLIVHMSGDGITAANGGYVPNISLSTVPSLSKQAAGEAALAVLRKGAADAAEQKVEKTEAGIYPAGLLEGRPVVSRLAYSVEVRGTEKAEQIFIDAQNGTVLARVPLNETALNRTIYSPQYDPENPDLFVQRREGDPPHPTPFVNNLYDFAGQTYNLYSSGFGRDSYDGKGHHMISVYLINQQCPNAYWNGTSTNYCPIFDADDVVSHEWSHAYTQFTHGLIYAFQSGALNESYSDIFGETVDLLNNADGAGGDNNAEPFPNGQRWLVGEDLGEEAQSLLLRDMYDPDRQGDPGKVSSTNYACGTDDGGGVHTNSGVPNHAYALIVDGTKFKPADPTIGQAAGTYNGQKITGIGFTKAAAIYFRAESVYQEPTSGFAEHDAAVQKSCKDLTGAQLKNLSTTNAAGANSNEVITAADCQQVAKAMLAVEMSSKPPCAFGPLLSPDPAPICLGSGTFFSEDWESGDNGWTKTSAGFGTGTVDWEDASKEETRFFKVVSSLPADHPGSAAFANDPKTAEVGGGTCAPGGDYSGSHTLTSPEIVIPAGATATKLAFEHYVATETGVDGGQVEISTNGGSFALLPKSAYIFNPPNSKFTDPAPVGNNTGPNPGEEAWTGTNLGGAILGSWGTTVADLSSVAQPGDTIKIRWTWSQDGCNGVEGWYVDNIRVFTCPILNAPVLSVGNDYEKPDTDGKFTLKWIRPAGAVGPDLLQESETSCGPVISDNAENGLAKWKTSSTGGGPEWTTSNMKPQHNSTTFFVQGTENTLSADSYLTYKDPIAIPGVGETFLNFEDWDLNEGDDNVLVEASEDGGTTWTAVYTHNRSETGTGPVAYATEPLFQRSVSLANFGGKTIRLRFRYSLGSENRAASVPFGWYVDNISIDNEAWTDVKSTGATSVLENKSSGSYCYRVRTEYHVNGDIALSPFSNIVNVTVAPGINFDGSKLLNISTRARVGTNDNILIGGFIVSGTANKPVILRALGPSLAVDGVPIAGRLEDPKLELFDRTGTLIAKNDDWRKSPQADKIQSSGFAPKSDAESVIVRNLPPGAYTTHLTGKNNGTGIGLVDAYDLGESAKSKFANISTRGFVGTGDNVMIAGFTAGADNGDTGVLLRGIGPSLKQIRNTVNDPTLVLKDHNGTTLAANDNWRDAEADAIENTGLAPSSNAESAILITLPPGPYTAIMRGKHQTTGLGIVEAYNVSLTASGGK